ncbi:unnamed protein product [Callosobruchus maculatus]|uniref:C3H1-type domain-containing protein n=1 Tax=Callosobruchus maculatus TaxID=64391 RepID=A0A653D072_CALMS|nr:unnamed protein product [Callosobruchus maculatus]
MSDTSEDTMQSDRQSEKEDNICRDFLRGICDRKFCKYKHQTDPKSLNFCHDYQNSMCPRPYCKFIHCTLDEVDEYKRTGQMSTQILAEATRKNQLPGVPPVCKQFKKGMCRRNVCKYRHITKEQEETEILAMIQTKQTAEINDNPAEIQLDSLGAFGATNGGIRRNGVDFEEYKDNGLPCPKRRFLPPQEQDVLQYEVNQSKPLFKGYYTGSPPSPILNRVDARTFMLEEENSLLHKEIAQLKKKVSDLTATNEFLLDQNAQLRMGGKRPGNGGRPGGPDAGSAAQAVAQAAAQQQATGTVIASVATVPVSLATVSTCNPVSGNHSVSIAGCPTVSIAPAAAAQILAQPSQQILVTTNPTSQLAIAAANSSQQAQLAIAQQNLANNLQAQPQLTSQAQLALAATTTQQLTSQAQQLALANTPQQLTVSNVPQQLVLAASTNQQLIATQTIAPDIHRAAANGQTQGINTSQAMAASQAQPLMSYPIITQQSISHTLTH